METFDAIIIGSGQGGTPLAKKLATHGYKTLLVEKKWVGGCCINEGCSPTKALLASARTAYVASHSAEWGVMVPEATVDFSRVMARREAIVSRLRKGAERGLRETRGLKLLFGEAAFTCPHTVEVTTGSGRQEFSAPIICIDTGLEPRIPPIEGLDHIPYLTSRSAQQLRELPGHLLILGGNYLGLEFAQLFARLGSRVTVVEQKAQILPEEDSDIAQAVSGILAAEGTRILSATQVKRLHGGKLLRAETSTGEISATHLLVAAGRVPATAALRLDRAGIETDEAGFIRVNDRLETSVAGVYALGDVKGGPAFTHIAYNDYLIVADNLLEGASSSTEGRQVPYCMFTDPQLGRIGLTEAAARRQGYDVRIGRLPMDSSARGIETGNTLGLMKAVVDASSDRIVGAAILAHEGGEVMSVLEMAMYAGLTASALRRHVFAHPLYSESLNNLLSSLT